MRALITGINGQDGSYLAEFLLEKGYDVYGLIRRSSHDNTSRIAHLVEDIELISGDLTDSDSVKRAVDDCGPDEIYNLGAMSFVPASWSQPALTFDVNCTGLIRLINASEKYNSKIFQASTSEMYGNSYPEFKPISPYGISKYAAHLMAQAYRRKGRYISCGISFNHESPRRGNEFVTKKITNYAKGLTKELRLGNTGAYRDWGYAKDFVEAFWLTLQQHNSDDYEIATGETHSVQEFLDLAIGKKPYIVDLWLYRPNEVNLLKGNPEKIKALGWSPSINFEQLVRLMIDE